MEYATERCRANKTDGSGRCGNWPRRGSDVCRKHGAGAPQVKAAAARNVAEGEIAKALRRKLADATPVTDPLRELQRLAGEAVTWKDTLSAKVDELNSFEYIAAFGDEKVKATVAMFTQAIRACHELLRDMARLNIDERQLKLEEQTVQAIVRALDIGLRAGGVTGPVAQAVKVAVAKQLRGRDMELTA